MGLAFHAWISGHPRRIGYFEDMPAWLTDAGGAWVATGAEILQVFGEQG